MKRLILKLVCIPLLFTFVQAGWSQDIAEEEAVRKVLEKFEEAYLDEDPGLLDDVLSDTGYMMVIRNPRSPDDAVVFDKQQIIGTIQSLWERVDYVEHHHTRLMIELHGPVATTQSVIRDRFSDGNTRTSPVYHILAREEGIWKVVFTSALLAE